MLLVHIRQADNVNAYVAFFKFPQNEGPHRCNLSGQAR